MKKTNEKTTTKDEKKKEKNQDGDGQPTQEKGKGGVRSHTLQTSSESAHAGTIEENETKREERKGRARQRKDSDDSRHSYTCKKSVLSESASPRCPPPIFLVVHAIGDWLIRPLDAADSAVAGVPTLSRSRSSIDTLCISPPPLTKLKLPSRCECECACEYGVVVRSRSRIKVDASCGLFADGPDVDEGGYAPFMLGLLWGPAGLTEEWP